MRSRQFVLAGLIAGVLLGSSTVSTASPTVFNLEAEPETGFSDGDLTSLTLTQPGLSLTITRPGDPSQFDVYDVNDIGNPTLPTAFGIRSLSPWFSNDGTAFVGNFSTPVRSVSIDMGDFGGDEDDLFIEAFGLPDAGGPIIASDAAQLVGGGGDWTGATLSVDAGSPLISSIRFMGGDDAFETSFGTFVVPNSVYYDNFTIIVPEPSAVALLGLSGVTLLGRRQRPS